jgi:hypothetical protein
VFSSLFGKGSGYKEEYERFKKSLKRNSSDPGLKAQFIKFCLLNRFTKHEAMEEHVAEAMRLFAAIESAEFFDLQCHYLVGKYHQEVQDHRKAYQIYLNAIKRFNRQSVRNPELKAENAELAYSITLNLLALQSDPIDPELEICFKLIRKSLPLHLKRVELENEMSKPAPDPARVKKLAEEVKALKAEEEKSALALAEAKQQALAIAEAKKVEGLVTEQKETPAVAKDVEVVKGSHESVVPKAEPKEASAPSNGKETHSTPTKRASAATNDGQGLFSKLFAELSPDAMGLAGPVKMGAQGGKAKGDKQDALTISPLYDYTEKGSTFMAYHGDQWEGPYTAMELRKMDFFQPSTWVCRVGNQQVLQAYEVPEIAPLFHHQLQ